MSEEELRFYSVAEVSKMLGQTQPTTRKWIKDGKIKAIKPGGPNGDWKISKAEVERLVNEAYGVPSD